MFDIYKLLRGEDNVSKLFPFIKISNSPQDKYETYILGDVKSRFDVLADKYYSDPSLAKVILLANPQYANEWSIPDASLIRIPFPKQRVLNEIEEKVLNIIEKE